MEKKKISLKEIGMPKLIMMFVAGVLLILLTFPGMFEGEKEQEGKKISTESPISQIGTNTTSYDSNTYIAELESRLESILRKVAGIGKVEVMITLKSSKQQIPLKDKPYARENSEEDDGEGGSRNISSIQQEESTVLVTNEDGKAQPYILQEVEPEIEGIVVIAEGGDNVLIIKDIMEAAEVLFGVQKHKVKVMKMSDGIK